MNLSIYLNIHSYLLFLIYILQLWSFSTTGFSSSLTSYFFNYSPSSGLAYSEFFFSIVSIAWVISAYLTAYGATSGSWGTDTLLCSSISAIGSTFGSYWTFSSTFSGIATSTTSGLGYSLIFYSVWFTIYSFGCPTYSTFYSLTYWVIY